MICHAGIFDGHRGPQAANYAAQHFQEHLLHEWSAATAAGALQAAFLSLDAAFKHAQVQSSMTYETCRLLLLTGYQKLPLSLMHGVPQQLLM